MGIRMQRGHVSRLVAQAANLGLFLVIVGYCAYLGWQGMRYKVFHVPQGYLAAYAEEGGRFFQKPAVTAFAAGDHPVLHNEEAAESPAYKLGQQPLGFASSSRVDVSILQDAKNLFKRAKTPLIQVHGTVEASVTEDSVITILTLDTPLQQLMEKAISEGLSKICERRGNQ
jgi:hypothetical protein